MYKDKIVHEEDDEGTDLSDEVLIPMNPIACMREILLRYEDYVNMEQVDFLLQCNGTPRRVLRSHNFKYLKEVLDIYHLKTCPMTNEDNVYANMMCSAAYIRRIELRFACREREMN